jgi:5S rRNA maturation endonuclease (ribonuclease M5)
MLNNFTQKVNVIEALNTLGIKHQNKPNSKGWLPIICIWHNDKDFGNASVNVNSGVIKCFKCGETGNVSSLLKERNSNYTFVPSAITQPVKQEIKKSVNIDSSLIYRFIYKEIDNPEDFYYLKQRGFTKEFCKEFKIVRSFTDPYSNYFAFPVIDKSKNIYNCEFRKLIQMETIQQYFNTTNIPYSNLSEVFKKHCEDHDIKIVDYKLYKDGKVSEDKTLFYLMDKKVKYESGSRVKQTLFNIDNLNYDEVLYLCEGIGSIPKLWTYISKNCTCTFGSQISPDQIEYLKKFKEIIIIPDRDIAGQKMVLFLRDHIKNLKVIDISYEDTDENFVFEIQNTNIISVGEYLARSKFRFTKTLF